MGKHSFPGNPPNHGRNGCLTLYSPKHGSNGCLSTIAIGCLVLTALIWAVMALGSHAGATTQQARFPRNWTLVVTGPRHYHQTWACHRFTASQPGRTGSALAASGCLPVIVKHGSVQAVAYRRSACPANAQRCIVTRPGRVGLAIVGGTGLQSTNEAGYDYLGGPEWWFKNGNLYLLGKNHWIGGSLCLVNVTKRGWVRTCLDQPELARLLKLAGG